jgi:hypothetical protein
VPLPLPPTSLEQTVRNPICLLSITWIVVHKGAKCAQVECSALKFAVQIKSRSCFVNTYYVVLLVSKSQRFQSVRKMQRFVTARLQVAIVMGSDPGNSN